MLYGLCRLSPPSAASAPRRCAGGRGSARGRIPADPALAEQLPAAPAAGRVTGLPLAPAPATVEADAGGITAIEVQVVAGPPHRTTEALRVGTALATAIHSSARGSKAYAIGALRADPAGALERPTTIVICAALRHGRARLTPRPAGFGCSPWLATAPARAAPRTRPVAAWPSATASGHLPLPEQRRARADEGTGQEPEQGTARQGFREGIEAGIIHRGTPVV